MNDCVMNDDMIIKNNGVKRGSCINIIKTNYIKIKIEIEDEKGKTKINQYYKLSSDFKVIEANENKIVKVWGKKILLFSFL